MLVRTPMAPTLLSSDVPSSVPAIPAQDGSSTSPVRENPLPRILIVDDEQIIADTIVQILNRNGFVAEAAYSGSRAIELSRLYCPELVLSDVMMPHVDGVEAAIAIRGHCPDTRIVLFSGQAATVEILERARERGFDFELLPKPIHPTRLIRHLRS